MYLVRRKPLEVLSQAGGISVLCGNGVSPIVNIATENEERSNYLGYCILERRERLVCIFIIRLSRGYPRAISN